MDPISDERLMADIQLGNADAMGTLVRRYQHEVYAYAFRMTGRRDSAEDVAQECFIRVYRFARSFRGESAFRTWLYRVARSALADWHRQDKRLPREAELEEHHPGIAQGRDEPETETMRRLERRDLHDAIARLPLHYREPLVQYHFGERSVREIAEQLGLPVKTVETRLFRGKALLKQLWLEGSGSDESDEKHELTCMQRNAPRAICERRTVTAPDGGR